MNEDKKKKIKISIVCLLILIECIMLILFKIKLGLVVKWGINMPRIQKTVITRKGKQYDNHHITIPKEILKETGWGTGDILKFRVYKGGLVYLTKID